MQNPIFKSLPQSVSHSLFSPSLTIIVPKRRTARAIMPCTSLVESSDGNGAVRSFKLKESTFLAAQMPKKEIAADRFIEAHPEYDGRGVIIAIFDSGVDPAAAGLRVTSDGKPKVIDVIDCTGSGDVDTSTVVKADDNCCITGASGASLVINSSWKNPSGEWHVGCKLVYELFTDTLTSRVKKERKRRWDEKNQEAIAEAVKQLDQFDKKHTKVEGAHLKMVREDLQNRVDLLRKQADSYDDKGPVIDAVVWHDGELWRAALDTQSLEDESGCGKLADFVPLTNYRLEQKHGVFSKLDACTCVLNVYNEGNILSIVTDSSPHATHVAGIAAAFHPEEPLLNGVAPGAQIVSCKIGDSRLGSMETGTGLTRALIAAVEHKCDLINMSYGEPTLLPDYGRFVDLVNEVVNKHRLIFVSSAGNNGPALTTVGAPGGTSSSIIGVGAYVSPAMAAGAHLLVEPPTEGLEYTWSSRGPTVDGDLGVSISAPGGAVAPVPTWTLQRRMLMNGTSMSSPSACGGVALIVSAMKAEGIPVSPYTVRKALENTSIPIGALPEEKLTAGQGLMQVDKAYDYMQKVQNLPCVWYQVKIKQAGITSKPTSSATSRGIYLREPLYCHQSTEWTVEIAPKFHEDANNLDQLVPFEECIELHSTGEAVVRAPDYLLLTHNGRSFSIVVDPTNLSDGLHYYEVYGVDSKAPWRGPLFRIPVTITKPSIVTSRPPLISFQGISFVPGQIEMRFIEVPFGATWVEATMRTYGFDTARRFFIDTVQLFPLQRPIKWESVATFSSPSSKNFAFRVEGGQTMELAIAQCWFSGIGSHETTIVDFEIAFRGINISKEEVVLDGSEAPVRIDAEALLSTEKLVPSAVLNKIRVPYRPIDCKLHALSADRDKLPSGKQILALTLTYKFKLEDDAELKPQIPLLNNRIYDNKFESQFYMISDVNKRVHAKGDVYPDSSKLPKGEYTVQLYLRHDNVQYLEKMKQLVLFIERKLEEKDIVRLNFYSQPDGPLTGDGSFNSSDLVPGVKEAFYVGPPAKDKLPKNSREGSVLFGPISYEGGKGLQKNPASYQISYIVPPIKLDEDKGKSSSDTKSVSERLEEEVRDAKIKILSSLNQGTDEERAEWKKLSQSLKRRVKMNMNSISVLKLVLFIFWPWLVNSKGEQNRLLVNMTLVQNATALGAYCLDGSLPAYHLHRGFGAGVDNWLLQFEGGGWCNDIKSCLDRSKSNHGSTRYMNKWEVFSGILSNNASFNPDFYNWNRVKIRYCDGASFSGDAKFYNGTSLLYFRGQRIWQAIILDLLPKGLGHAKKAMLSGCSAGGLATFLHCDNFTSYLPNNASVKCLSDAGFFLDERDIALNHTMRSFYEGLITLQGVEPNLNLNCTSTLYYPHLCFFPQYALPFIETPFFILNSAYDVYQFHHILVPPSSDPRRHWDHCKLNVTACDTSQLNILQGFRIDMLTALRDFYQNSTRDGMYINSCFTHCQSETQDTWFAAGSPRIHNKTIAETVGDWYFSRNISKEIDCAYPCDTTCHHMI